MIAKNISRRHLDTGQRAFVANDMREWVDEQAAKKRQEAAGSHGIEGGRGNKETETLPPKSAEGFDTSLAAKAKKNSEDEALHLAGKAAGLGATTVTAYRARNIPKLAGPGHA